jgi:aminoglycoside phosphotransferase (APT) family kinase protein
VDDLPERLLEGGRQTEGVVRVGGTVRRPLGGRSDYVQVILRHLAAVGFDGAPRLLGIDEQGREVLSYLPGEVIASSPALLSDARLQSAAALMRRFHDATAGTPLAEDGEVVCHGDLGPHNIVFDGERAVGLIDWNEAAPGPRLIDFAHAVWCCADVAEQEVPLGEQRRKIRLICDGYGWQDARAVIDEIADRFRRARDGHAADGRAKAAAIFDEMVAWMDRNKAALKSGL